MKWNRVEISWKQMLGFAIVGCGMIARFHARALAEVPGAKLLALVSRHPANAQALMEAVGCPCEVHTDLKPVLGRRDIHVVIVTTPSGAHLEPALAAAEAGKHVVVEQSGHFIQVEQPQVVLDSIKLVLEQARRKVP